MECRRYLGFVGKISFACHVSITFIQILVHFFRNALFSSCFETFKSTNIFFLLQIPLLHFFRGSRLKCDETIARVVHVYLDNWLALK